MSSLAQYASLGIDQPKTRVLEWYLACVLPKDYEQVCNDLAVGRELINPVDAFERIVRNNQPIPSYKSGLDYATSCFPRSDALAKEAARWMLRWEPELTRTIGKTLVGEQTLDSKAGWTPEKYIAHALLCSQMMSSNWENPRFVERWEKRLAYRTDLTPERRQIATAKAYWALMGTVHPDWASTVWAGTIARANPKHRESLEMALSTSHDQLQQRTPTALPGLPTLPPRVLVSPPRLERTPVVPVQ